MGQPPTGLHDRAKRRTSSTQRRAGGLVAGTGLLTPSGYQAIETLRVGDEVATLVGHGPLFVPVIWIGRRTADRSVASPVRIRRDAIGANMPQRDIVLAPDQAIHLEGVLYRAADLVNGVSIRHERQSARVDYWCVRLQRHNVVVGENLALESVVNPDAFEAVTEPPASVTGVARLLPRDDEPPDPIHFPSRLAWSIRWFRRRMLSRGIPNAPSTPAPRQAGLLLPDAPQQVNLAVEIRAALAGLAEVAARLHARLELAAHPALTMHIAPRKLHEILDILLVHAMEATPGGKVLVGAMRHHDRVHIAVIDDGTGKDPSAQRAELRRVEEVVALLGGRIEIDCRPNEGTTILLRLPTPPDR